ncbi:MAG: DUF2752 domain-containing protein [Clostridia bacterium]|nr:DUF2752 domain-containing protein [Clostridia bacterium]
MKLDKNKKTSIYIVISLFIIALIGIILVKVYNPEEKSFFIPCMLYKLTGIKCPGCGMTRSVHYLVNGNIKQAIWYNLMLIPLIVLVIYSLYRYILFLVKNEPIINKLLENLLKVFLVIIVLFGVTRNFTTLFY